MTGNDLRFAFGRIAMIRLSDVSLSDERYRMTVGEPSQTLVDRIARWGCLVVPIGQSIDGLVVPVAGFKRLHALARSGWAESPVAIQLLPDELDVLDVLAVAARDVRRDRDLGPFEVARGIRRALDAGATRAEIRERLLPELGLEVHDVVLKRHLKLERVPAPLADWLDRKGASLRRALRFAGLTARQGALLVQSAEGFRLSLRALEECSRMLGDVARRDDRAWADVAEEAGLLSASGDPEGARPAKVALKSLWRLRYPTWDAQQKLAEARSREVGAPARVRFEWDETFERDGLTLAVDARTIEELRSDLEALTEPERLARIGALLEAI